jgi:hypothetical protein
MTILWSITARIFLRLIQALGGAWARARIVVLFLSFTATRRGTSITRLSSLSFLLLMTRSWIHFLMGHPAIGEKILIIGEGQVAFETAQAVWERRDTGYRIAGFISEDFNLTMLNFRAAEIWERSTSSKTYSEGKNRADRHIRLGAARFFSINILLRIRLAGNVNIEEGTTFYERVTGQVNLNMLRPSWLIFSGHRATLFETFFARSFIAGLALLGLIISLRLPSSRPFDQARI